MLNISEQQRDMIAEWIDASNLPHADVKTVLAILTTIELKK